MKNLKLACTLLALTLTVPTYGATLLEGLNAEGNTLVPLRKMAEALGVEVGYVPETREISVFDNNTKTTMFPDQGMAKINGKNVLMSIAPQVITKPIFFTNIVKGFRCSL